MNDKNFNLSTNNDKKYTFSTMNFSSNSSKPNEFRFSFPTSVTSNTPTTTVFSTTSSTSSINSTFQFDAKPLNNESSCNQAFDKAAHRYRKIKKFVEGTNKVKINQVFYFCYFDVSRFLFTTILSSSCFILSMIDIYQLHL